MVQIQHPSESRSILASACNWWRSRHTERNFDSDPFIFSMPCFARTASFLLIILTKAWRFSLLTTHVWTLPNLAQIRRSSVSLHLVTVRATYFMKDEEDTYPTPPTNNVLLRTDHSRLAGVFRHRGLGLYL